MVDCHTFEGLGTTLTDRKKIFDLRFGFLLATQTVEPFTQGFNDDSGHRLSRFVSNHLSKLVSFRVLDIQRHIFLQNTTFSTFLHSGKNKLKKKGIRCFISLTEIAKPFHSKKVQCNQRGEDDSGITSARQIDQVGSA